MKKLIFCIRRDPVLAAAVIAAAVSCFFVIPSAEYIEYIDTRVICLLFSLMLVVAGFEKAGVFSYLTDRLLRIVHSTRMLAFMLVGACFFGSMLVTNDVALITFVPFAILTLKSVNMKKILIPVTVLMTVAANLGSMLTPIGNPQNLYIYSMSGMSVGEFIKVMLPLTLLSGILLCIAVLVMVGNTHIKADGQNSSIKWADVIIWAVMFVVCLLSVAHIIHYGVACIITAAVVFIADKSLFRRADYGLLLTFIFFFIFIGNMKSIPAVSNALTAVVDGKEIAAGVVMSQVISNVPAAMLLSGFTDNYTSLLKGVNIGGLGTLIASMASLISYKLYAAEEKNVARYMFVFSVVNAVFLAVLVLFEIFI